MKKITYFFLILGNSTIWPALSSAYCVIILFFCYCDLTPTPFSFCPDPNILKWKDNCFKKLSTKIGETTYVPRHTQLSGFKAMNVWLKVAMTVLIFEQQMFPKHRHNKWIYSECMGEWINQQRCYIVWNATINHSGLMRGRGKGQWCKEQWGEDAPFVVVYYSQSRPFWLYSSLEIISAVSFLTLTNRNRSINKKRLVMDHIMLLGKLTIQYIFRASRIYVHSVIHCQSFNQSTPFTII